MPDVRMPDGTVIRDVPEGTTKSDLRRRLGRDRGVDPNTGQFDQDLAGIDASIAAGTDQTQTRDPGLADQLRSVNLDLPQDMERDDWMVAAELFGRDLVNNLFAVPSATGELVARGAAAAETGAESLVGRMRGQPPERGFGERFQASTERQRQQFPASALRAIPSPTMGDLIAEGRTARNVHQNLMAGQDPNTQGERAQAQQQQQQRVNQLREAPGAGVGEMGADIATVLTGRRPLARSRAPQAAARRQEAERALREKIDLPPDMREELNDVVTDRVLPMIRSAGVQTRRATGKATETGIEGAMLAAIDEGDPSVMFGLGAAGQATGSAGLWLASHPVRRLLPTVATAYVASEMFKAAGPGAQDFFESKDFAIQKALGGLALGATGALAGAGRLRGPKAEQWPALFDAITAVPRSAVLSRISELTEADQEGDTLPMTVMETIVRNPDQFNRNQQNALSRALQSEREGAFRREVNRLMEQSSDFRDRVGELRR